MNTILKKIILPIVFILICGTLYLVWNTKNTTLGNEFPAQGSLIDYKNSDYNFTIALPLSWSGYTVVSDSWKAYSPDKPQGASPDATGPLLSIRNPLWSTSTPRQDIPIMIFTLAQWDLLNQDKIHIGAAPINPSELSRNGKYVFALPARYNYAYPLGYEEVESILQTKPIHGF